MWSLETLKIPDSSKNWNMSCLLKMIQRRTPFVNLQKLFLKDGIFNNNKVLNFVLKPVDAESF